MNRRRFLGLGLSVFGMAIVQPTLAQNEPTRQMALNFLRKFLKALEEEAYEEADAYLFDFPHLSAEKRMATLKTLIEKREISAPGLDLLAEGEYGPLCQVFPEHSHDMARRASVPPNECWAFRLKGAKAGLHWDGNQLKLFYIDDIGKLTDGSTSSLREKLPFSA